MQVMSEEVVRSLGPGRFLDWKVLNAMGTAGGVLICWDKRSLEMLGWKRANFPSPVDSGMWEMEQSGCSRGSMVLSPEKIGSACGRSLGQLEDCGRSHGVKEAISIQLWLVDVPLQGGSFTWSRGLNNQSWAKLDRFLATPSWLDQYSRVLQRRLPRPTSDHFLVLLEGGGLRRGPSPFKFENMWLKAEGFKDLIERWWQGIVVRGRPSYRSEKDLERECVREMEKKAGIRVGAGSQRVSSSQGGDASFAWVPRIGKRKDLTSLYPKAKEQKGVGALLVEVLREMEPGSDGQRNQQLKEKCWSPMLGKSFADVVKQNRSCEEVVRVKIVNRPSGGRLKKLAQCLVGSWDPMLGRGDDLRSWGTQMSKLWWLRRATGEMEPKDGMRDGGREEERGLGENTWPTYLLMDRDTLCKIGEGCGEFLDIDAKTERMEELQWARIRVRIKEDRIPNMVDIWMENTADDKGRTLAAAREGEGESQTREGKRVMEEEGGSRLETQTQVVDGMWRLTAGVGQPMDCHHGLGGSHLGPQGMECMQGGPLVLGLVERPCGPGGLTIQSPLVDHVGLKEWVDFRRPRIWKPKEAPEDPLLREKDDMRRLSGAELIQNERSPTDFALAEEAMRYDKVSDCLVSGTPSLLSPVFGRTPVGEYCDFSGDDKERDEGENPIQMIMGSKSPTGENVDCWIWWRQRGSLAGKKSDLAKFSNFLGFSTEGSGEGHYGFLGSKFVREGKEFIANPSSKGVPDYGSLMKLRILSWNVRGANDSSKRRIIKAVIRSQRVNLFCLQETKIQSLSEGLVRSLGADRWSNWVALDAVGSAGGTLVCWDKRSLEVMETEVGKFSVSCRFRNVENGLTWFFTGVYEPFSKGDRECLWEELGAIRGLWEDPWCLGGDFNVILSQRERNRQGRLTSAMRIFAQTVDELELMDLPMQGGAFTWSGGRNNQAWARLDRFLVTQQWLEMFSGVAQCRLQRPTSDHFPILLMGGGLRRGPTPFRFENMWLKVDGFKGLLREWWQGIEVRGRASFRLASKLKLLKLRIKTWNREVFGRLEVNKNSALQQVEYWDGVESERCLSFAETEQKKEAKDAFHKWVLLEEVHWRQKSRELWLKEGDRNTGYFHRMANAHRRNNSLDRIMINGAAPKSTYSSEAEDLEKPFTEEEIHGALMEMRGDKAPRPDGFTMAFWQECWSFVKEEMMDLFKEFFEYGSFSKCLNNTFLVLIPKKGGAEDLGDFRPISLLGGLYKILAKVLANRLKKVLDRVVSAYQNAFVRGRQILDASLVANEVIDYWHKRKEKGLICKLDIEKAYDSLNWEFLMKGLRQGDPLSPYLFILGMEVLTTLFRRAGEGGFLSGCRLWGRGGVEMNVSHLLFADDTIIFCKAEREQVSNLSWILAWFEAASGLRINLAKSALIPVGQVEELEEMAAELGCRLGALPTVYLGLPLGAHHKTSSSWDGVEERMRRRLAQWKRQYISKGGRITLIKSTLASIPIYFLSLIRIPKSVTKRIEKIQRDFLWGGGRLERKAHLIKWKVVCSPKEEGGLGIRKIDVLNKALLGKWCGDTPMRRRIYGKG
ncbi:Transposon TX1 uncharacterized 149 kDa protein [Vitis vinifera]|uniref:Transposon TX1 uncharacterized 149 kDa protein n=1 Tax=Vitis vinifera TaxID=29760 RepID=A0A438F5T6_VITVI|nr:Transposon TX1 uncharacterized 149 kDa protein [Vitis vinifera]